ncbi:MAG: hypothetical protein QF847_00040 [Candidatus Marinimicrobia bacterium]|jgi:hypothetical protein|nr:hypothetical protein [Candidatus Neomarinimicrobiota bacterium]MDP6500710.1 hypothetical protein [Candidatus Neomarinimicrobiota bacterium]MDP6725622.1 hypothetical protein [Candidatus Neomarinimicrobiota bacterium]|tara:strand:+ start:5579 stop:5833 length:255 start_codon:yes stop_codon:yes gene_type:complete
MTELCGMAVSSRDEQLITDGWSKQFTCGEPRLSEACELFSQMNREIHLEDMVKEDQPLGTKCDSCFVACGDEMKTIWTRQKILI